MWKIGWKGLWAHKFRLLRTCSAVLLGVAFLAGTLVLGDTMRAGFENAFSAAYEDTDVVVQGADPVTLDGEEQRRLVPEEVLTAVAAVDGVAEVVPALDGMAQVTGSDGESIGGNGPPTLGGAWDPTSMNPYDLVDGRAPAAAGEVVIDRGTARTGELEVGDTTTVRTPTPATVTVVGIVAFGTQDSLGGSGFTAFTPDQARELLLAGSPGATSVSLSAVDGVEPDELATRVAAALPEGFEARTGAEMAAAAQESIGEDFLNVFQTFLLVFTAVALLVSTFSIYNTFSVILAQRSRESALLRAIGATRRQVLGSIGLEAVVVGLVASVGGLVVGIGLATGLTAAMRGIGVDLAGGLTIAPGSIVASVVVGLVVTLLASLAPAVRAARISPMAALRDAAIDRSDASKGRAVLGVVLAGAGIGTVTWGALGAEEPSLALIGLGAVASLIGMVVLGPVVARPAARALGAPISVVRGTSGELARGNAMRNPRRTAGTASALMIGVSVVALFTVVASSLTTMMRETIAGSLTADLVVMDSGFSGAGTSPEFAQRVGALDQVDRAVGIAYGPAVVDGEDMGVDVADPEDLAAVVDNDVTAGSMAGLAPDEIAVARSEAEANGWDLGTTVPIRFVDGAEVEMTVAAIFERTEFTTAVVMSRDVWNEHNTGVDDWMTAITLSPGTDVDDAKAAIEAVGDEFGAPEALTRAEYADDVAGQITQMLSIVYVMLALSIVIALMGISNTLALSIHERTRELGLLRAIGQTRGQLRSMVRWESVIIAVFGTVGGIGLGLFLAWGLVTGLAADLSERAFTAPVGMLAAIALVGALAGVLAGVLPARRAARLDVLDAIASE